MIKLQVIGHLGRDCSVKDFSGKKVVNFTVAHSEKYKDAQGVSHEKAIWVECSYWNESANVAQYLKKGQLVYVEGIPDTEAYLNKDNEPRASLRLTVRSLQLLGGSSQSNNQAPQNNIANNQPSPTPALISQSSYNNGVGTDDDLPF